MHAETTYVIKYVVSTGKATVYSSSINAEYKSMI